ncbi:MAG: 2-C-methyl-D-erythritol 2,4-cyclodiphosphate synthase [Deferribacteres bacterium]|nr:2-C-methyl-D-erythritol 2,4-cyclodiphosphate synthase [candidate division KSB1 bacterium]MCB9502619.1 2-C-methyl-D-erythritol 2,4-cyclodiphosphate synthase [Deferribacteres bacterium]
MRIGQGYDVHQFVKNRPLILGGVNIPHEKGLAGHSDADALLHAIGDAILGAAALGDLGKHFPDTDPAYANFSSLLLLREIYELLLRHNYTVVNVDSTIVTEAPKIAPHIEAMRKNIAQCLKLDIGAVSVKATTSEKMGFVGKGYGLAVHAIVLIAPTTTDV